MQTDAASALAVLRSRNSILSVFALALTFFLFAFLRFGWTQRFWWLLPLLGALSAIIVLDQRTKVIPDVITLPGIVYALIAAVSAEHHSLSAALLGMVAGGGLVWLIAVISRGSVGGGDIKLMAMLGAALGWKGALSLVAVSHVAAALVAVCLLSVRRAGLRDTMPVGAFISLFGAIMLLGAP